MFKFLFKNFLPEPEYDKNCKTFNLVQKFFERAHMEGCNEILFGIPPGEVPEEISDQDTSQFDESLQELNEFANSQNLDIKIPTRIEISAIPIWMKCEDKWRQIFDIPTSLHHECIRALYFYSEYFSMATVKVELPLENQTAYANLDVNENYNYILTDIQIK